MASFRVHTIPGSPFARAVLATLIEKEAPFILAPIAPGTLKSAEHLQRNPFGRIPALEHDGFDLYETQAILRYIDRVVPVPELTPVDARSAARMDQVMNICDWYLFQGVANIIAFQRVVGLKLMGLTPDEQVIAGAMPKAHMVVDELSRLLGRQNFFCGNAVSLADIHVASQLDFMIATPEWTQLSKSTPNLTAWMARMNSRRSMQATTWERVAAMAMVA